MQTSQFGESIVPGTHDAFYHYDDHERLTKLGDWIDNTDGLQYAYDAYSRLTKLTDYDGSDLDYVYDSRGRVVSMNDYHGNTTSYGYDAIGRFTSLTAPGSKTWSYAFDGYGRLTRVDIPNGMHTEYGYDGEGRQTSIHHKDGGTVKQGFDYEFATGGNITRIEHEDGSFWEYEYDNRDQLTMAERGNAASPTILATYEYVYDAGGNMLTKEVPWYDDFEDGNKTGWSGHTANYSVVNGELRNTLDASVWRDLYLSETDADHDLKFDYVRYSSTGLVQVILRYTDNNNYLYLEINPTVIHLRQRDGGTLTTLDTISTTVAEDVNYHVRAVLSGANVQVFWGAEGASFDEILSTASATELTTSRAAWFRVSTNSEHGFDNVQLIAGTRSTTETFTYNNANEQITHAKNGVTTDMEYDAWGSLTKRDDGTHEADYTYRYGGKLFYSLSSNFPDEENVNIETGGDGNVRSIVADNETWINYADDGSIVSFEDDADGSSGSLALTYVISAATAPAFTGIFATITGMSPASGGIRYHVTDHRDTTRSTWDESKLTVGLHEFDPLGAAFASTGQFASGVSQKLHDSGGGELLKAGVLARSAAMPVERVLASIVLCRLQDLNPIGGIFLFFLLNADIRAMEKQLGIEPGTLAIQVSDYTTQVPWMLGLMVLLAACAIAVASWRLYARPRGENDSKSAVYTWAIERVNGVLDAMRAASHPLRFLGAFVAALACWVLFTLASVPLLLSLGIPWADTLRGALIIAGATTFFQLLPSAPTAAGTFHLGCTLALASAAPNLAPAQALAFAVVLHGIGALTPALPGILLIPVLSRGFGESQKEKLL